jgi:hypothetical protein
VGVEHLKLKDKHTWKSKPGYSICVIDRGLVRFDYPSKWLVEPDEGAMHLHDLPPSVESCDLGVSVFRIPAAHISALSVDDMLRDSLDKERKAYRQSEIHHGARVDIEIAWLEQCYVDEEHNRDARFRVALARGRALCLISMNYWSDKAASLEPVWDEVLRSLVMGDRIEDPTKGPVVQ